MKKFTNTRSMVVAFPEPDQNSALTLTLNPATMERVIQAAEWAKNHPEEPFIQFSLLEKSSPKGLMMVLSRVDLLSLASNIERGPQPPMSNLH